MTCSWCGAELGYNVLSHVCEDGTTFDMRMQYAREGRRPPHMKPPGSLDSTKYLPAPKKKDPNVLYLTKEDVEWLKGNKIDPQVD